MDSNNKNLNINGYGSCGGGEFQEVKISGKGKINNDIKCIKLKISGSANIYGNVNSENISISGILKVKGNVNALNSYVSGLINIDGGFKGNDLNCDGSLTVKNDIECESIVLNGSLTNKNFINCENIEINLQGLSACNEIGAHKVSVWNHNSSKSFFKLFLPKKFKENKLEAKTIEADEIFLESCCIDSVKGKNIKIGLNSYINEVEYSESIEIDPSSKVEKIIKCKK